MKILIRRGLPFVEMQLIYQGKQLRLGRMLLDTGSVSTLLSTEHADSVGLIPMPEDPIHEIRGVGGVEIVFSKVIDCLAVGDLVVENFEVEVGLMDYGIEMDGIVGLNFLTETRAFIDLERLEVYRI